MATIYDYLIGTGGDQDLGQTQTADQPMPEYLTDASARAIEAAKGIASEGYTAYGGPRVAGLSPAQQRAIAQQQSYAGQGVAGANYGIGTLGNAQSVYNAAAGQGNIAGGMLGAGMSTAAGGLGTLGSSFDASQRSRQMAEGGYGATADTMRAAGGAYGLAGQGARGITGAEIQGFMNPYATNVIDAAARKFREEGARQQTSLGAKAAMSGGFGGSRAAILSGMQQRTQTEGIGDLYSKGLSSAYESALSAAQEGRKRQISGSQAQTQAGNLANQATLARLQAAGQSTAAGNLARAASGEIRQFGALQSQLGGQQRQLMDSTRQLGDSQRGFGMDQIKAAEARQRIGATDVASQLGVAGLQQGIDQRAMDVAYADFLREQEYPKEQINFLSGIIKGTPYATGAAATQQRYDDPSNFDKFMGYATGAIGLYGQGVDNEWWEAFG